MDISPEEFLDRYLKLKYPHRPIREDITLQDLADVVLMLAQEVTDLKKRIQQLETRQ